MKTKKMELHQLKTEALASFLLPDEEVELVTSEEIQKGGKVFFLDSSVILCVPTAQGKIDLDLEIAYRQGERVGLFVE